MIKPRRIAGRAPVVSERLKCWKLTVEYDGTRYFGWQEQANVRTILGELRKAAESCFGGKVELGGAGRTDAGVHALGQVAHLRVAERAARTLHSTLELVETVNDSLPGDISVLAAVEVSPRFHARHDATSRTYLYQISTRKTAFSKKFVWWVKEPLDLQAMRDATKLLPGRHDFSALSKYDRNRPEESTIVVVENAEITMDGHLICFRITASHFLWNQVRRTVGALVDVGKGQSSFDDFSRLIKNEPAEVMLITAPASGLFLEKVSYLQSRPSASSTHRIKEKD